MFDLHPQLAKDTVLLGQFELSEVLLMNDVRYPWIILVPRRDGIREIYQLEKTEQQQLWAESSFVAEAMANSFNADKMNVAAIGNMVPQLHLHHIARYTSDSCWPKPVWGIGQAEPYTDEALKLIVEKLQSIFTDYLI